MLNNKIDFGLLELHPMCRQPRISSLMFADDLVIFYKPTVQTVDNIFEMLASFYQMTCLRVNLNKSDMKTA